MSDKVILPEWIQNLQDECDEHLTEGPWDRDRAADLWVENGSDLILKVRQLLSGLAAMRGEVERLRTAVVTLRDHWPAERWATLSAICRDHPCIDQEYAKAKE